MKTIMDLHVEIEDNYDEELEFDSEDSDSDYVNGGNVDE